MEIEEYLDDYYEKKKRKKKIWGVNSINHKDKGISLSPNHLVLFVHVKMFFTSQVKTSFRFSKMISILAEKCMRLGWQWHPRCDVRIVNAESGLDLGFRIVYRSDHKPKFIKGRLT